MSPKWGASCDLGQLESLHVQYLTSYESYDLSHVSLSLKIFVHNISTGSLRLKYWILFTNRPISCFQRNFRSLIFDASLRSVSTASTWVLQVSTWLYVLSEGMNFHVLFRLPHRIRTGLNENFELRRHIFVSKWTTIVVVNDTRLHRSSSWPISPLLSMWPWISQVMKLRWSSSTSLT